MKTNTNKLSKTRIQRIREQGYQNVSDTYIKKIAVGNRFAYQLCALLLIIGVSTANQILLFSMLCIAALSTILPNHVFDYPYNVYSSALNKEKIPPRSVQLKFACSIAVFWIATTMFFFANESYLLGYLLGGTLAIVASLVGYLDICIPSIVFNKLTKTKVK